MKLFKFIFVALSVIIILAGSCLFYAFKIEPYRLQVSEYSPTEESKALEPIKIVQFSDVHIKEDFTYENLHKVVSAINKQQPDIVVFTGDLYDNYAKYNDDGNIIAELQEIKAAYAKVAIWGNRDYGGGAVRQYASIMEQGGFTLVRNETLAVEVEHAKSILFTGLDDSLLGSAYIPDSDEAYHSDYQILLSHEPDVVEDYLPHNYNLILSGHSHGGQVNVPFLPSINKKAISATSLSTKYAGGMYAFDADTHTKLYVNTGIGTTHISARFGVVPEISVFDIYL